MKTYLLVGVLSSLPLQNLSGGWLERKAEGWFWYEDREKKQKVEEQLEPPTPLLTSLPASSAQIPLTATEEMALIRKDLEERLNKAMLDPTEENVIAYMHMQQHWIHQSAQFSQVWLRNLLNAPELDSRLHDPVTQYGVQVQKQILREQREERIRDLAKTYGLFFFYEGNNKVSQAFSFVVGELAKKYGWQVIAIACDGFLIPEFENSQLNHGIAQRLNVEMFPALFLVEPNKQMAIPIAYGLSSVDQIEDNIDIQLQAQGDHP